MRIHFNLIVGIITFLLFAWDMEHTHNVLSWIYLLIAILNLGYVIAYWTAELVLNVISFYFKDNDK